MIKVVRKCLSKSEIEFKKWDYHFAFMHFKRYDNAFINGKPLKWYSWLKKGDLIEVVDRPKGLFFTLGFLLLPISWSFAIGPGLTTAVGVLATVGAIAGVGFAASALTGAFASVGAAASTTQSKEYSSTTQPELTGANNDISSDILPVVFGKTQQTPSYGQLPYRLVQDGSSTNKYRQYFIANYKNVDYSDFKLGETSIDNYSIDYVNIDTVKGAKTFIGFDNVKALSVDEQLSYNADEEVNQSSTHYFNSTFTQASSLKVDFTIEFSNVDLGQWTQKSFQIVVYALNGIAQFELNNTFTINSSDLTLIEGSSYRYSGTYTWTHAITEVDRIAFAPTTKTRGNTTETNNELDCLLVDETITAGDYTETAQINQSVNRYLGTVSEVIHTSPEKTVDIDVIISFPQGLYKINKSNGERQRRSAIVEIMYKTDGGNWTNIANANALYIRDVNGDKHPLSSSSTTVLGNKVTVYSPSDLDVADQLFFRPIGFTVPEGKYAVRVRSADFSEKTNYDIGYPQCSEIQFYVNDVVVNRSVLPKVNQIAFEATAYKGLSGTLKKFNYIAEAEIPIWNGYNWNTVAKTTNPAAIVRYLLTDKNVNPRAEKIDHIDNDSLVELYEWCEQENYQASGVISEACKIGEIITNILANCQALMIPLLNGKHTFVIDKPNKIPIGLFNQHNSWDFSWTPSVGRQTEAIRVSFVENDDYTEDELTLYYYNGDVHDYPEVGKTDLDYEMIKKEYKYVNDRASVRKAVEYELRTIQEKRNTFEFKVNLEALNMILLDRFYVSNTSNMQNESSGLIQDVIVEDGLLKGFKLYSQITIPDNAKIVIRSLDYKNQKSVVNIYDVINKGNKTEVLINTIQYDGIIKGAGEIQGIEDSWHYDGDLFTIGQDTVYDCTAIDIKYNEDNTATITAREY